MTFLLATLLLICPAAAVGGGQSEPDAAAAPSELASAAEPSNPASPPGRERLDEAIRLYHSGQRDQARRALALLVNDESIDDIDLRQEARVYLGEVFLVQGDEPSARKTWEIVLRDDPGYRIDGFRHPPDVVSYFEVVRAYTLPLVDPRPQVPPGSAARPPAPGWVYAGFGIYQLGHGRPGVGVVLLVSQASTAAVSIAKFTSLTLDHGYVLGTDQLAGLKTERSQQWAATLAFWSLYTGGTLGARRMWARQAGDPVDGVVLSLTPGGMRVGGRF